MSGREQLVDEMIELRERLEARAIKAEARIEELLALVVKLSRETPFDHEGEDARRQVGVLLAELVTERNRANRAELDLAALRQTLAAPAGREPAPPYGRACTAIITRRRRCGGLIDGGICGSCGHRFHDPPGV